MILFGFIMEGQTSGLTDRLDIRGRKKEVHLNYSQVYGLNK